MSEEAQRRQRTYSHRLEDLRGQVKLLTEQELRMLSIARRRRTEVYLEELRLIEEELESNESRRILAYKRRCRA